MADAVIAMPVGEMEKNVQDYLEVQVIVFEIVDTVDGYIFAKYWKCWKRLRCKSFSGTCLIG